MSNYGQYPSVVTLKTDDSFMHILFIADKSPFYSHMLILK